MAGDAWPSTGDALCEVPRRPLEHLAAVPAEEGGLRLVFRSLGRPGALAVVAQQGLLEAGAAVGLVGYGQGTGRVRWAAASRLAPYPAFILSFGMVVGRSGTPAGEVPNGFTSQGEVACRRPRPPMLARPSTSTPGPLLTFTW